MMEHKKPEAKHVVAVIGAGPAGLYAARALANAGVDVVMLNRDLKPGGLAEYGIYPSKHKMKEGLRKQFRKILTSPEVSYLGGVQISDQEAFKLEDLRELGFSAVLFAIGAQGTRRLGLRQEGQDDAKGVFHAKDLVYHFNQLPPFASRHFDIGQKVGIIGMGNVMVDVAHWLVKEKQVEEVTVIARRGPNERAYTDKEMREIVEALDQEDLKAEFERIGARLEAVGQDPEAIFADMLAPLEKAYSIGDSPTRLRFRFLVSSKQIHADDEGRISGLEVEHNELVAKGDKLRPQGTGEMEVLELDTLVYAIGDQVDSGVGLPFEWGQYIVPKEDHPRIEGRARYEVYDPESKQILDGWFVGGWARIASDGLVGKARADGETAVEEVLHYLDGKEPLPQGAAQQRLDAILDLLHQREVPYMTYEDVQKLEAIEQKKAEELGRDFFKFNSNQEMFDAIKE